MASTRLRLRTRVLAVTTEASQLTRTIRVHRTFTHIPLGNDLALGVGISTVTWRTPAGCDVVIHAAFRVYSAVAWVLALFIATSQSERTIVIDCAFRSCATNQWISTVSVQTVATCSVVVVRLAQGVRSALGIEAWVNAFTVHAGQLGRAVRVRSTSDFVAHRLSVSGESTAADAKRTVELHVAFGVLTTHVAFSARIDAALIETSLIIRTVVIRDTFWSGCNVNWGLVDSSNTLGVWRSVVVGRARADSFVVDGVADGTNTTGIDTWVPAPLIVTGSIPGTIGVDYALWISAQGGSIVDAANTVPITW